MALQLVLENSEDKFISSVTITEIESDNPSLLENIQNVCNQYAKLNVSHRTTNMYRVNCTLLAQRCFCQRLQKHQYSRFLFVSPRLQRLCYRGVN
jgi:hypothetical protein